MLQRRRRQKPTETDDAGYRDLSELRIGAPVVHIDHGVGRYKGLETLTAGGQSDEFLTLEYAGGSKLYVPVSSLHLISRYAGTDEEHAPLHKLGTERWSNAKQKALEKIRDTTANCWMFTAAGKPEGFQFEDPKRPIGLCAIPVRGDAGPAGGHRIGVRGYDGERPMDRLVCSDVGFGKPSPCARLSCHLVWQQVAVLVPTISGPATLRVFPGPFLGYGNVELLSRFRSGSQTSKAITAIEEGKADIVIGTHKLLQGDINFKNLGLVIIDEEHRFGVQQKEKQKSLRAEVDMLTLTATDSQNPEHGHGPPARPVHYRDPTSPPAVGENLCAPARRRHGERSYSPGNLRAVRSISCAMMSPPSRKPRKIFAN